MALDFAATYKILVLGDSNVGKTCIVHRYCDERYYDTYISTIGMNFSLFLIYFGPQMIFYIDKKFPPHRKSLYTKNVRMTHICLIFTFYVGKAFGGKLFIYICFIFFYCSENFLSFL